jgi:hypothetical protein
MSGSEPWRWGALFDIEVPASMTARDLGDMIELRLQTSDAPLLMAAFSPVPGPSDRALADALVRFAATRGLPKSRAQSGLLLSRDADGVVAGRLSFVTDLFWEAYALAWAAPSTATSPGESASLVLAFCAATGKDDPIFEAAAGLLSTLRPLELLVPAADRLPPEAPGDF